MAPARKGSPLDEKNSLLVSADDANAKQGSYLYKITGVVAVLGLLGCFAYYAPAVKYASLGVAPMKVEHASMGAEAAAAMAQLESLHEGLYSINPSSEAGLKKL